MLGARDAGDGCGDADRERRDVFFCAARSALDEVFEMTVDANVLAPALEHLKDGAFGVSIRETNGSVLIERVDPVISTAEVAELLGVSGETVRRMADSGRLHPIKTPGGMMRFRKSRLVADLARLER